MKELFLINHQTAKRDPTKVICQFHIFQFVQMVSFINKIMVILLSKAIMD